MTAPDERELICISCPVGCQLTVATRDGELLAVRGNKCPKGISYARAEILDPRRILTTTVRIRGGSLPQLPVRTRQAIPKSLLAKGMEVLSRFEVDAPVRMGDVLIGDFVGTGVDVIASRSIDCAG
jgi:CxxC motif-containing protein